MSGNYPARWYGGNGRSRGGLTPAEQIAAQEAQACLDIARQRIEDAAESAKAQSSVQRVNDVTHAALEAADEIAKEAIRVAANGPLNAEMAAEILVKSKRRLGNIVEERA